LITIKDSKDKLLEILDKNTQKKFSENKLKIYAIIRANGGWENWDMIEIAKYNCKNATEARIKEQEHYELSKPNV
jgi:hypothetical protein